MQIPKTRIEAAGPPARLEDHVKPSPTEGSAHRSHLGSVSKFYGNTATLPCLPVLGNHWGRDHLAHKAEYIYYMAF